MSNPPFTSPLLEEDDDLFSFPPNLDPNNINTTPPTPNPLLNEEINPEVLLPTISPPMLDYYQDLSLFLDDHNQEEDFGSSIGQILPTTSDWVAQLEQVGLDPVVRGPIDRDDHQAASGLGEGEGSSSKKKLAHNAKERVRRLKLNDIYVALRSLLPESKRPKEKWSAPYMIDRALEYTPQLQAEVEKLTLEKTNLLSLLAKKKALITTSDKTDDQVEAANKDKQKSLTVSINEVKRGEVIIQICQQIFNNINVECCFSTLIEKLQGQGMNVVGASSLRACGDRQCFHLHLQMGEIPLEDTYIEDLHKRLVSWLS